MKPSITFRLFIALAITLSIVVLVMVGLIKFSFSKGFLRYINKVETRQVEQVTEQLQFHYLENGNWEQLRNNEALWREISSTRDLDQNTAFSARSKWRNHDHGDGRKRSSRFRHREFLEIGRRLALYDSERIFIAGIKYPPEDAREFEIILGNSSIAWLVLAPLRKVEGPRDLQFLKDQSRAFYAIALFTLLVAVLGSILISRQFLSPIRQLASATRALCKGELQVRLPEGRKDELGDLAVDFNRLAATLSDNERHRKQWVMDIAHELRTPLTVLRGEIEALQDGLREWNAENSESLRSEILRLSSLVDDLYELSLADSGDLIYRMEVFDLVPLIQDSVRTFSNIASPKSLEIKFEYQNNNSLEIFADRNRLKQLVTNLLENSIRYTDPNGTIIIRCKHDEGKVILNIDDTKPGVPTASLERLFDRLYRVDHSRNRATGGAGIGLAMCRQIVDDHHGKIFASHSELGGLGISIELPLSTEINSGQVSV